MDLDAMTILLGDAIFNIKEEEYCEACQHALKNPYEVRTNDENDERGEALNDYDKGNGSEDNNSDDSKVNIVMIVKIVMVETIIMMTMTMKEVIETTMVAETAVTIRVNPLVIERMKM